MELSTEMGPTNKKQNKTEVFFPQDNQLVESRVESLLDSEGKFGTYKEISHY